VAKQKCGTCRFFQEAGLAGSGWCHHPERKTSSGVMIMVRRNELACRNEWQRSLWTPRDVEPADEPAFQRLPTMGPVEPATPDHLRALAAAESESTAEVEGEDVLLSEARIVSEAPSDLEPVLAAARARPLAAPVPSFDARSAVFRAREAYRERNRAKSIQERPSLRAQSVSPEPRQRGTFHEEIATEAFKARQDRATMHDEPRSVATQSVSPARSEGEAVREQQRAAEPHGSHEPRPRRTDPDPERSQEAGRAARHTPAREQLVVPHEAAELDVCPEGPGDLEADVEESPARHRAVEQSALPSWFRTDLPRICRACRDYRPSADGQRGWCANDWAFTHSRLVHADDVAPCQSAIGDWWVPVDDVWLVAADVSAHGRPTPLLDRLLGDDSRGRKRS
jgi:hypothetical protein